MKELHYMISDTAKKVEVEAHVLRYWEEELELTIGRNEMGHRYYTEQNIYLFRNIKELKEQGFQLKAIKMLLPQLEKQGEEGVHNFLNLREELNRKAADVEEGAIEGRQRGTGASVIPIHQASSLVEKMVMKNEDERADKEIAAVSNAYAKQQVESFSGFQRNLEKIDEDERENRMQQFRMILGDIVKDALKENNEELGKEISHQVSDGVIKEMDYLFRLQDEQDEERFRKMDETIRTYQRSRRQRAVDRADEKKKIKLEKKEKKKLLRQQKQIEKNL